MYKILLFIAVCAITLASCKKDGDNTDVATATDGRSAINSSFQKTQSCAQALHDGDFVDFLVAAFDLQENEEIDGEFVSDMLKTFEETYISNGFYADNRVNFDQYQGIYSWDSSQGNFTKQASNTVFEIHAPSKESAQTTLDLTLRIDNFNEIETTVDGEVYYVPNAITTSVSWKNKVVFSWMINNLTVDPTGSTTLPISFYSEIYLPPYTHTINLTRNNTRKYTLNYSLAANGGCSYEINLTGTSNTDTYEEFVLEDNLILINGSIVLPDVTYVFNANTEALSNEEDISATDLNRHASVNVMSNSGVKLAELLAVDRNGDIGVDIVYSDNSRENFEDMLTDEAELLGNIFEDLFE
jgi:hypothetical protein